MLTCLDEPIKGSSNDDRDADSGEAVMAFDMQKDIFDRNLHIL